MKAFITGITGFVGGFLAEHLLASGDQVLGCSARAYWPHWAASGLPDQVELLRWDMARDAPDAVSRRLAAFAPDCIFHLAALSVPSDCGREEPTPRALAVNVEGTSRVAALAASLPSRPRMLFASTSHVYATVNRQRFRVDEAAPLGPRRGYGITKLAAEQRLSEAAQRHALDVVIARSFQHTGPRQEPKLMLPEWACQLARPGVEPVHVRNRDTWIDLSDARDVVRAYRLLVQKAQRGEVYNVGSGVARRTGDVFDLLRRLAGADRPVIEDAPGERWDPVADHGKLVARTGWKPEIALEKTLEDTFLYWRMRTAELDWKP